MNRLKQEIIKGFFLSSPYQILIFENQRLVFSRLVENDGQNQVRDRDGPEKDGYDRRKDKFLIEKLILSLSFCLWLKFKYRIGNLSMFINHQTSI